MTTTIASRIEQAAPEGAGITFIGRDEAITLNSAEFVDQARAMAANLEAMDIGRDARIAILGTTGPQLARAIVATWLTGAAVSVLPRPRRLSSMQAMIDRARLDLRAIDHTHLLVDDPSAEMASALNPQFIRIEEIATSVRRAPRGAPRSGDLAVLQLTSGSTADSKVVPITHRQICSNLDAICGGAEFDPTHDAMVSWLPLFHDMGLIGFFMIPLSIGMRLAIADPETWLTRPARWMEWVAHFQASVTGAPNGAYAVAARLLAHASPGRLDRMRLAFNGAEPIDPATVEAFTDAGTPHGLRPQAMFCVYGLAEVTLAATFPRPGVGMEVDVVDAESLQMNGQAHPLVGGNYSRTRRLPFLGRPLAGLELRIVDPATGAGLAEREVGELEIRGSSVATGYYRRPDLTRALFRDGWLRTGDRAYMADGQLVVCDRLKDLVILMGRNISPEVIEQAAGTVAGVRQGNVVAFSVPDTPHERLVIVAEHRGRTSTELRSEIAEAVRSRVDAVPDDIVLIDPGVLPKTSSGKLQRALCRKQYLGQASSPQD